MWMFCDNPSVTCECAKTSELVLVQSHVLWTFHLWMFSVGVGVSVEVVRCASEWNKHINMLYQCAKQMVQSEWGSLLAKFMILSVGNATMSSGCERLSCHSIHLLPLLKQVMEAHALVVNIFQHLHLSLRMYLTMSCDKVATVVLVAPHAFCVFLSHLLLGPFSNVHS